MSGFRSVVSLAALLLTAGAHPAFAQKALTPAQELMPPPTEVRMATRAYPTTTTVRTNHAGWSTVRGYANVPQELKVIWNIDRGGEALLEGRAAWSPEEPWRELAHWGRGVTQPERRSGKGEEIVRVDGPTLLRVRARAPKFPRSGVASVRLDYLRHTVAILRGPAGAVRHPVILAEGYDPLNAHDMNDPDPKQDPVFARLITEGRRKYGLDTWLLDWGDGGASLEQQAEDFAELARGIRSWGGDRDQTVAVGISMGAVTLQYALAEAAGRGERLGVRKYISINGPHQGAWISPKLRTYLLKRAADDQTVDPGSASEAVAIRRGLNSPAAQELLIGAPQHEAFYGRLRTLGKGGYHPDIPHVAFSNGTLAREGNELADFVKGKAAVTHQVSVRLLWLPFWIPMHRTRREFRYGSYPGELLPSSMTMPVQDHVRLLSIFRADYRATWRTIPTFIPTHSALDFPEELVAGEELRRYRYSQWQKTPFSKVYVARGRNLAHDETQVDWIDPRTGKNAPAGENAVLYEISH
jgi:hypothetical protein